MTEDELRAIEHRAKRCRHWDDAIPYADVATLIAEVRRLRELSRDVRALQGS